MKKNTDIPQKKTLKDFIGYILLTVALTIVGAWYGYIVDTVSTKNADYMKAFEKAEDYLNVRSFINAIGAAFEGGNAQLFALLLGAVGFVILAIMGTKENKRFHRKGFEHGSARWGTDAEKKIIQDTHNFYNNVILASDVFIVLNRDKRSKADKEAKNKAFPNNIINLIKKKTEKKKPDTSEKKNNVDETIKNEPIVDETTSGIVTGDRNISSASSPSIQENDEKLSVANVAKKTKKAAKIKPMHNLNMMILGGSGTGKSRFFVKPNLLQCNSSFVVTDPSGELLKSCGKMLERNGYKIKVFNVDDMSHSSNYNPFHYLKDLNSDNSDDYDENSVIKMINVFMMNTKQEGSSGGDQFWDDSTRLLLSAVTFLILETFPPEGQNFATILEIIHKAHIEDDEGGGGKKFSEFDGLFEERRLEDDKALSVQYYDEFRQAAGKTMQSILISTTTKLQHFKLEKVRNLTAGDNIQLEELGDEKQALFIIIPSTDTTYNFLAAMMYTQLFDTLYSRAMKKYENAGGHLKVHVQFILDEFANVGKIPDFDKILATCRKFWISCVVILQNLTQLKRLYEKSWEELPGNCDSTIFLGGKDQSTNEYIMKSLGKETIDTLNVNKTKGKEKSTSYNDGIMGRELMTQDELEKMENSECIVMVRGIPPFKTDKFDVVNHPRYEQLDEAAKDGSNTFELKSMKTKSAEEIYHSEGPEPNRDYDLIANEEMLEIEFCDGGEEYSIYSDEELVRLTGYSLETIQKSKETYAVA